MKITKLEHSGVVVEKAGKVLVFDPVEFTEKLPELEGVVGIVITHKHGDHLQPEQIERILKANPGARVFAASDAVGMAPNATALRAGDTLEVGGFKLDIFGGNHASIITGQVPCENIGVAVDGKVMNPGDSFDMAGDSGVGSFDAPEVLLVPIAAPWCKIAESIDFAKKVRPKKVIPVHDAVLSDLGKGFNNNWLRMACEEIGAEFCPLGVGESVEVG